VIATTNRLLRDEVKAGRFREDLFYRLNVFPLQLMPLRERKDDIIPLAQHILAKYSRHAERNAPAFSDCAKQSLTHHDWQGNVRELDNVLQRALILQSGNTITAKELAFETMSMFDSSSQNTGMPVVDESLGADLRSHEQRHILEALEKNNCSRRLTAKELGISERTLRYKLSRFRELGIAIPEKVGKKTA